MRENNAKIARCLSIYLNYDRSLLPFDFFQFYHFKMTQTNFMTAIVAIFVFGSSIIANSESPRHSLKSLSSNDLSDANCPKGWKIIVLNLGKGGFNCESLTCACHDSSKDKCNSTGKKLSEVKLPEKDKWECFVAPAGCIWCGPKSQGAT